jgi:hypothetical protein
MKKRLSRSLTSDSSGELHVLWHDGNSLGMDWAEVGVFKETDEVSLWCFLESKDSRWLESEVILELWGNFSYESLERKFPDKEFSALLESSDFSESNGTGSESVGFLDTTAGLSGDLLSLLVGDVLSGCFATGVLSCGLLGSCHFDYSWNYCY